MAEPRTYSGNGNTVTIADPGNITRDECLALARCGANAWNQWRDSHPGHEIRRANGANFQGCDLVSEKISFEGFRFGQVDFSKARFPSYQRFLGCSFGNHTLFEDALFEGDVRFQGSNFGIVDFNRAVFGGAADFKACDFKGSAHFEGCQFEGVVVFAGAFLRIDARFDHSHFKGDAHFSGALFGSESSFLCCVFNGQAVFEAWGWSDLRYVFQDTNLTLEKARSLAESLSLSPRKMGSSDFSGAVFRGPVSFAGRSFGARVAFDVGRRPTRSWNEVKDGRESQLTEYILRPTCFAESPLFFDCEVNQQLTFDDATFPAASGDPKSARAYRTLKLAFSQQQATREEQRFFCLEMAEEAKAAERGRDPVKWLYIAYREIAGFGFSVRRPALLLAVAFLLMLPLYAWQAGLRACWPTSGGCSMTGPLIQFASAHALPGLEKLAEPASKTLFDDQLGVWTVLTLLVHKAISVLALFLIGLALRNLFKMK